MLHNRNLYIHIPFTRKVERINVCPQKDNPLRKPLFISFYKNLRAEKEKSVSEI